MKRFLWDHAIPQQVHTPSSFGPAVILKTTDTWVSSLKWPGYCNSWNTQVISADLARNSDDQIRRQPKCTNSFSHVLRSLSLRNQSSDFQKQRRLQPDFCHLSPRSSDNSVTEMTHWRSRQWANPTDLTQRVLNKTWPSPTHHLRGQLVEFAWEQMQLWGKGCRPLAHCVPMLWCLGVPALMLTM